MTILVVGVNHKTAPIALREQVAFSKQDIEQALPLLAEHPEIEEAVIISTCNRVELYCYGAFESTVRDWLFKHKKNFNADQVQQDSQDFQSSQSFQDFQERCYVHEGVQAVEHLMRVACGLDSLVLGEPEILGQVKSGFTQACLHGSVGTQLSRLFRQTFGVAKKVRTSTKIGACPVSIASTAVGLAQAWLKENTEKNIQQAKVLIVGSGDTSTLAAKHMAKLKPQSMIIVGRNASKVDSLAQEVEAVAAGMETLASAVNASDIIVSATASDSAIIDAGMFNDSAKKLVLDLAVPRDVSPEVELLPQVKLVCIDGLRQTIKTHSNARVHAAQQADNLIAQFSNEYMLSLRAIDAGEMITRYRTLIEQQCQQELEKTLKNYKQSADVEMALKSFANNLTKKIMHTPCEKMRLASAEGREEVLQFAYELFGMKA